MKKRILINIYISICLLMFSLIIGQVFFSNYSENKIDIISYYSLILILYVLICAYSCKYKLDRIYYLYILFYIVFTFGNVICRFIFNFNDDSLIYLRSIISDENLFPAIKLSCYSLISLNLGVLVAKLNRNKIYNDKNIINNSINLINMRKIAIIVIIFSFPFAIKDLATKLLASSTGGYGATFSNVSYGLANLTANIVPYFYLGLLIILTSYKYSYTKARLVFYILIIYSLIQIMIGNRGLPIIQLITSMLVWHNMIKPIKKNTVIKIAISFMPLSIFLAMMSEVRVYPLAMWIPKMIEMLKSSEIYTYIFKIINEMGTAIYPIAATIVCIPKYINFKFGSTFLYSFALIFPNLSTNQSIFKQYTDLPNVISKFFGVPFGGSILQEGYANFGLLCVFFMFLMGIFIVKLDNWVYKRINYDPIIFPLYAGVISQILWSVRNNIAPIVVYFMRYIVVIYIFYRIMILIGVKDNKRRS